MVCSADGRQVCKDGTLSPSCTCTPPTVYECMDSSAKNYNPKANKSNGKCTYYVKGCTDENSINYNSKAEKDDGSCVKKVSGCTDENALNYNSKANVDDGNCEYRQVEIKDNVEEKDSNSNQLQSTNENRLDDIKEEKVADSEDSGSAAISLGILGVAGYFIGKSRKNKK